MDCEQDTHRGEVRDHRRAADAHERERDAGDRGDSHRHADVHEDLEEEREDDPARDDGREEIPCDGHDAEPSPEHEQIEREQDHGADKTALLGVTREREVGVRLG